MFNQTNQINFDQLSASLFIQKDIATRIPKQIPATRVVSVCCFCFLFTRFLTKKKTLSQTH